MKVSAPNAIAGPRHPKNMYSVAEIAVREGHSEQAFEPRSELGVPSGCMLNRRGEEEEEDQGLTLVHVRAQLERLQDTFMS
jgi:hypothetical protein